MHNFQILGVLMKKWYYSAAMFHSIFACPRTLVYRKFKVVIWLCLVFGVKNVKTHFFKIVLLLTKFVTSSLCAYEQLGAPHWKTVKKMIFFKKQIFYYFLKHHNFRKLTTDFENRTKRKAETKAASFWMLITRPYPTKQVQSHFWFECKILKFQ